MIKTVNEHLESESEHMLVIGLLDLLLPAFVNSEIDTVDALRHNSLPENSKGGIYNEEC